MSRSQNQPPPRASANSVQRDTGALPSLPKFAAIVLVLSAASPEPLPNLGCPCARSFPNTVTRFPLSLSFSISTTALGTYRGAGREGPRTGRQTHNHEHSILALFAYWDKRLVSCDPSCELHAPPSHAIPSHPKPMTQADYSIWPFALPYLA